MGDIKARLTPALQPLALLTKMEMKNQPPVIRRITVNILLMSSLGQPIQDQAISIQWLEVEVGCKTLENSQFPLNHIMNKSENKCYFTVFPAQNATFQTGL